MQAQIDGGIRHESMREVEWRCRYVIMGLLISKSIGWITVGVTTEFIET